MKPPSMLAVLAILASQLVTTTFGTAYAINTTIAVPQSAGMPAQITAADIRLLLSRQLGEHALLIASIGDAMISQRPVEAEAFTKALDDNSSELAKSIGIVYGPAAEAQFLPSWRKHIGFVRDYISASAVKDHAKAETAAQALIDYSREFAGFIAAYNPNLPDEVVTTLAADLVKEHVLGLKTMIDAQAANDSTQAFRALHAAHEHMDMIAKVLADVITKQFPAKFSGAIDGPAVELRVTLNGVLAERTYLIGTTTNAIFVGQANEADAGGDLLSNRSAEDFAAAIEPITDNQVGTTFLPAVREHASAVLTYARGLMTSNKAKTTSAHEKLLASSDDMTHYFATRIHSLKAVALGAAFKSYQHDLECIAQAQAAHDPSKTVTFLRSAYAHVGRLADPIATGIVEQLPDRYGLKLNTAATPSIPMPVTGGAQSVTSDGLSAAAFSADSPDSIAVPGASPSGPSLLDRALAAYWRNQTMLPAASAGNSAGAPSEAPTRVQIRAIHLDAPIVSTGLALTAGGNSVVEWRVPDYRAAGWLNTSAHLGDPGNLVLSGHHNIDGKVFEHLLDVRPSDEIVVSSAHRSITYVVTVSEILPEKGQPEAVRAENALLIAPTIDDRLTLVTCWPPSDNTHRLVIIARKHMDVLAAGAGPVRAARPVQHW